MPLRKFIDAADAVGPCLRVLGFTRVLEYVCNTSVASARRWCGAEALRLRPAHSSGTRAPDRGGGWAGAPHN